MDGIVSTEAFKKHREKIKEAESLLRELEWEFHPESYSWSRGSKVVSYKQLSTNPQKVIDRVISIEYEIEGDPDQEAFEESIRASGLYPEEPMDWEG